MKNKKKGQLGRGIKEEYVYQCGQQINTQVSGEGNYVGEEIVTIKRSFMKQWNAREDDRKEEEQDRLRDE